MMEQRVSRLNERPPRTGGRYVLDWRRWNRRIESNHALAFAADLANHVNLPLVFLERITCKDHSAGARFHTFQLEEAPGRPVYGTIRSLARSGMERKTGVSAYLREIEHLERTGEELHE